MPAARILASDVYEWAAGGFFVVQPAYGRVGDAEVGGVEIIGYGAETGSYRSQFFDSFGNISTSRLTVEGDTWTWSGERTRCTAVLSDHGKTFTAHHERSSDGVTWEPSMAVVLRASTGLRRYAPAPPRAGGRAVRGSRTQGLGIAAVDPVQAVPSVWGAAILLCAAAIWYLFTRPA